MLNDLAADTPREASLDPVGHLGRLFSRGVSVLSAALQPEYAPGAVPATADAADAEKKAAATAAAKFWEDLRGICWCPVRGFLLQSLGTAVFLDHVVLVDNAHSPCWLQSGLWRRCRCSLIVGSMLPPRALI